MDSGFSSVSSVSNSPTTGAIMAPCPKCTRKSTFMVHSYQLHTERDIPDTQWHARQHGEIIETIREGDTTYIQARQYIIVRLQYNQLVYKEITWHASSKHNVWIWRYMVDDGNSVISHLHNIEVIDPMNKGNTSYRVDTRFEDGWCCGDSSEISSDELDHLLHWLWSPSLITIINLYVTIRAMVYLVTKRLTERVKRKSVSREP